MTNTKEYNEAVEILYNIFNKARNEYFEASFEIDRSEVMDECDKAGVKAVIDALGVEIVSNESCIKFSKHLALNHFGQDIVLIRDEDCYSVVAQIAPDYLDVVFNKLNNNKSAVYLETIKGAE